MAMEKRGVVDPAVTPIIEQGLDIKHLKQAEAVKACNKHVCKCLDNDFTKRAAERAKDSLKDEKEI